MRSVWIYAGLSLLLAACATPEFKAEKNICASEWITKIPPRFEREIVTETRTRQVPTGRTICKQSGTTTICDQVTRPEYYFVNTVRTVDRNKSRRDVQITACTQTACVKKYGNAACEA